MGQLERLSALLRQMRPLNPSLVLVWHTLDQKRLLQLYQHGLHRLRGDKRKTREIGVRGARFDLQTGKDRVLRCTPSYGKPFSIRFGAFIAEPMAQTTITAARIFNARGIGFQPVCRETFVLIRCPSACTTLLTRGS